MSVEISSVVAPAVMTPVSSSAAAAVIGDAINEISILLFALQMLDDYLHISCVNFTRKVLEIQDRS